MIFDQNKLETVILTACWAGSPDQLGAVKLHKVLYFLDMRGFIELGASVTGADYVKQQFGPICAQLQITLEKMEHAGSIAINSANYFGNKKYEYTPQKKPKSGILSCAEDALLKEVIDFVCVKHSAKSISAYSHQAPWKSVDMGQKIPYFTAQFLYPTELTPRVIEAFSAGIAEIEKTGRNTDALGSETIKTFRSRIQAEIASSRL
jgi:hypothetical protein